MAQRTMHLGTPLNAIDHTLTLGTGLTVFFDLGKGFQNFRIAFVLGTRRFVRFADLFFAALANLGLADTAVP